MLLSISILYAQENKEETGVEDALSKWGIRSSYQIGNASIARNNSTGYALNTSNYIWLLEYTYKQMSISSGYGASYFEGNGFNNFGNFNHERIIGRIPLFVAWRKKFKNGNIRYTEFGLLGQFIRQDEFRYLNRRDSDLYENWNLAYHVGWGYLFQITDNDWAGLSINYGGDFTDFSTTDKTISPNGQRMAGTYTVGFEYRFTF